MIIGTFPVPSFCWALFGALSLRGVLRVPQRIGTRMAFRSSVRHARSVPSSSFSAHLMTLSIFSLPCVTFATMTVLMA
jgi:hypothetical protein